MRHVEQWTNAINAAVKIKHYKSINQYSHTLHRKKPLLLYMYQSER